MASHRRRARNLRPCSSTDATHVLTHEMGHAGLGFLGSQRDEFAFLNPGPTSRELAADDIEAIRTLYRIKFQASATSHPSRPKPRSRRGRSR